MKKVKVFLICAVLIISSIIIFQNDVVKASENTTLYVGGTGPGNYTKIQNAIDLAKPGDTIYVYNGTYYENIVINKSINLMGENKNSTVINGTKTGSVIHVFSNYVNITGFNIKSSEYSWPYAGVFLENNYNKIYGNHFSNNNYGIIVDKSNYNKIYDNTYNKNWGGVYLNNSNENFVYNETIVDNMYGIGLLNSGGNNIINNLIICINDGLFMYKENAEDIGSNDNTISGNKIVDNGIGIRIRGRNNKIYFNKIVDNGIGIRIRGRNNKIYENEIINNTEGIIIDEHSSQFNLITKNLVKKNDIGILIKAVNDNTIYNNNFLTNYMHANDSGNNSWFSSIFKKGNYWDDYDGCDSNRDGIGDTPYNIPGGSNQDKYPLMNPYGFPLEIDFYSLCKKGINFKIINTKDYDISDISWSIAIKGGFFNNINITNNGTIEFLHSDQHVNISSQNNNSDILRKFGKVEILITLEIEDKVFRNKTQGFVFGQFVFISYELPFWAKILLIGGAVFCIISLLLLLINNQ